MRRGYDHSIRTEAITRRYQGRPWSEIRETIKEKYGIRPSIRQMQKWFENYQGTADDPTGAKFTAKIIEDTAKMAQPLAQAKMLVEIMPVWGELQREPDITGYEAGWMAFLSFFEAQIGRENFDKIVQLYMERRDKVIKQVKAESSQT